MLAESDHRIRGRSREDTIYRGVEFLPPRPSMAMDFAVVDPLA